MIRLRRTTMSLISGIAARVEPAQPLRQRPRVTVVVLCYKYGHFLQAAVASVLSQEGVDIDVIIVDDGSPDNSSEVARGLAAEDPRVHALILDENQGPVGAFNCALPFVTGTYLVRLDADDILSPGALARATALLESHPEVGFVYGRPLHFRGDKIPESAVRNPQTWTIWDGRCWLDLRCRLGVNCMTSPEVVMRTTLQHVLGGQLEDLGHTHDMEMWLRAARHMAVGRVNGADQALIRVHPNSRMRTMYNSIFLDLEERHRAFQRSLLWPTGRSVPQYSDMAASTIARQAIDLVNHAYERRKTDEIHADQFVNLALRVWPPIAESKVFRKMTRRRAVGARLAPWVPFFFVNAALRSLRGKVLYRYWKWSGL
jgi:glycosyltransferase involved in cell wall biosynthesis